MTSPTTECCQTWGKQMGYVPDRAQLLKYSQTCFKRPYKTRYIFCFSDCCMKVVQKAPAELSALLSFSNKQPRVYSEIITISDFHVT